MGGLWGDGTLSLSQNKTDVFGIGQFAEGKKFQHPEKRDLNPCESNLEVISSQHQVARPHSQGSDGKGKQGTNKQKDMENAWIGGPVPRSKLQI